MYISPSNGRCHDATWGAGLGVGPVVTVGIVCAKADNDGVVVQNALVKTPTPMPTEASTICALRLADEDLIAATDIRAPE
jgi:hypothetical protein